MEFSPLYTRRLSGNSTLNSFKEDALEQLEFNVNDISRASSPASVISIGARSEGHRSFRDRRYRNSGRGEDEYRRKYSRMKAELELHRMKAQQFQQEREEEMRKWKDAFENDRRLQIVAVHKRVEEEKKREIAKLKEDLLRQKDFELQQVLFYRESERKQQLQQTQQQQKQQQQQQQQQQKQQQQQQQQKVHRVVETHEKGRRAQEHRLEKDRADIEDSEENRREQDGDNDIAVAGGKLRARANTLQDEKRKRRSAFSRRSLGLDSKDGGSEHKRSSRELKSSRSQDELEEEKENNGRRRRGSEVSSKLVDKVGSPIVARNDADYSLSHSIADGNTASKNVVSTARTDVMSAEDTTSNGKSLFLSARHKSSGITDAVDSNLNQMMVDEQTQVTYKDTTAEEQQVQVKERQTLLQALHQQIKALECEKSALLKHKDEIQTLLNLKCAEEKIREQEFMSLKMGYERELRTVINEHRKIALENIEKLKLAETILKEATLTDEEISLLAQQHERKRRLSSSSLPAIQVQTKKEDKEKEKTLQKKLGELATHVQRLERRIALLRTENDALRKKQDDQKPLEEKIRSLKKRNAELAAIARRLEEKAKALQQENTKARSKTATPLLQDESGPEVEHLKRVLARQRAKDLSEHAKSMLAKDKEIEDLRRKCQQLADLLSNADIMEPQNAVQFEEKVELVNIIKQAAKERLQLEQQLAHINTKQVTAGGLEQSPEKVDRSGGGENYPRELEEANEILHKQIEKLEQALHKAAHLEQQAVEKTSECASLRRELSQAKQQQLKLEEQLSSWSSEQQQLNHKVQQLQERCQHFDQITEECNTLKISLASVQKEREAAEEEVKLLNLRVQSLENLVRDLQESAENASQVHNERTNVLQQLHDKQAQLEHLQQVNCSVESKHAQTISALNKQVLQLEELRRVEEKRREDLAEEVQRLHKEAEQQQRTLEEAEHLKEKLLEVWVQTPVPVVATHSQPDFSPPSITDEQTDIGGREEKQQGMDRKSLNQNERSVGGSLLSSWAQNGPIQVYIAKYNYDPFEFSPNENPEAELPLTAGDYVLVVGEMDEDGFFDGELIDGRQGLVPSNFIERVEDEDLMEFHAALLQAGHGYYSNANMNSTTPIVPPPAATSTPGTTNNNNNNNNDTNFSGDEVRQPKPVTRKSSEDNPEESFSDLEDIAEIDEDDVSVNSRTPTNGATAQLLPPCPRSLCLDRQLTNSLLISWRGPDPAPGLEVQSYQVLVDGQLKTSVKCTERTKALIEGVSSNTIHRVCVRCLSNKGQSKDAQCTMLVGKDVYPVPSELKISHVSPTSASLSWLAGNSNYQHSIVVNGTEVKVVKPGVFRTTLTGLAPGTLHKVTLIAKSISGALNEEKSRKWVENVSASIEFRTTEAGTTEPPLNVQVESGPRVGTILLTWLPVTINSSGVCNGVVVTGYHIMADGRKVQFVSGPTSDHVVLSCEDFKPVIPSQLSVRTVCKGGLESSDSEVVLLAPVLVQEMTQVPASVSIKPVIAKAGKAPSNDEQKDHDTDEEIEEAFREAQSLHKRVNAVSEPYSDCSSSELSDIPEVEEDLIASQDSRVSEVSISLTNQTHFPSQVEKGSPQPAPRKLVPSAVDAGPKEFHAQKPTIQSGKLLAAPARIVPAIEIIRDSSTERGTSADEDMEDTNIPSTHTTPTNVPGKGHVPDISASFGDAQNLSAFRQVDQTRHKDSCETAQRTGAGVAGQAGEKRKAHRTQPTIYHTSKPPVADSRSGPDNQNPKQRHGKTWTDTSQGSEHRKHAAGLLPSPISLLEDAGDTDSISGEINSTVDANSVRLFIALFDYDPVTMSPNVDCIDEELPFREGQILKVFGDKDADGFYKGESLGRIGYIPCNMVSEVQIDDPDIVEQLLQETAEKLGQANSVAGHSAVIDDDPSAGLLAPSGVVSMPQQGPIMRKMIAMYDYDPQELSPNVDAEMELSFKTGDIVMIYGDMDEDGFFTGEVNGQQGLVPSNFLQPAPSSDDDGLESSSARSRSGESLDAALNALTRTDISSNVPRVGQQPPQSADPSSHKQPVSVNFSDIKSEGSRAGTSSPADDDKPKKKGGFLHKSKNIFKKFTR